MDTKRWQEIQSTFDSLVEMDDGARTETLSALRTSDPELHAAVERLLAADADADARLTSLDFLLVPQPMPPEPGPDPLGLSGRMVAHFQVSDALGVGGMGVVYRGQDTRLGRAVALKFLLPHYVLDASAKARFLREARAAAALDHPNLCTIHDLGETEDGRLFLAMPLYTGETLRARLAREGSLPVATCVEITRQIARGVQCAHTAGIIHRDLKPGNVMLLPDGTVKILDFGLAKALDETTSATSAAFGTVAYMSPEQVQGEAVDARTDLWAVGVMLYQMLTGRKPFAGEKEMAIAHAIVHAEPVPPSVVREGVPDALEEIVLGLLQKDQSARYSRVDDLVADLDALGTLDENTKLPHVLSRRLRPTRRRVASLPWLMSLGVVLVVSLLGGKAITSWLNQLPPKQVSRYSITLPDADLAVAGNQYYRIAISPDGKRIAYVGASSDGRTELWLRSLDQLHARPLAGTEGAANPFFSPDGSRLGFLATGPRGVLKVVSLDGGPPITVTDSAVDIGGAAWGYDGYIYFDGQLQGNGLARVPENGGVPEPVTSRDAANAETWHYQPAPLPNGRGVLFVVAHGAQSYQDDIAVLDLKSGVYHVLLHGLSPRYAASGHLVYETAGGALMAAPFDQDRLALVGEPVILAEGLGVSQGGLQDLTISATGTVVYTTGTGASKELVWVARDGTATPIDSTWRAGFSSVALSPDGAELAVSVQGDNTEVWVKRLGQGPAWKLKSLGGINDFPAWTGDGRAVTLLSNMGSRLSPNLNLYVSQADGSDFPQRLLTKVGSLQDAEYSRDGKWLVYRKKADLFAVRTTGDTTSIPLVATRFYEASPRLSPDGRWLAYTSNESGPYTVYVRPFPNTKSARWRVSDGADPLWSRSGRELFYKNGSGELVSAPVLAGDTFALGTQKVLFSIEKYENYWQWRDYDVTPDGRHFVMIRSAGKPRDELIVVENFFEELKEKVRR